MRAKVFLLMGIILRLRVRQLLVSLHLHLPLFLKLFLLGFPGSCLLHEDEEDESGIPRLRKSIELPS